MTEDEWLAACDPTPMLRLLQNKASDRKFRLFAVACCRRIWRLLKVDSRKTMEMDEQYADGMISEAELQSGWMTNQDLTQEDGDPIFSDAAGAVSHAARFPMPNDLTSDAAENARWASAWAAWAVVRTRHTINLSEIDVIDPAVFATGVSEYCQQVQLLRCILGNPFSPITLHPSWLTPNVTSLAQAIYDNRQLPSGHFDNQRMGVLADALEKAGCDNADVLNHCRSAGPHVRGCWAVDLLLGKS